MSLFAKPTTRSFYLVFFGVYFVLLVGGFTLTHLSSEYTLAQQMAAAMLLGAVVISFCLSSLTCTRYCFGMSLKRAAGVTAMLAILGLVLYAAGGIVLNR